MAKTNQVQSRFNTEYVLKVELLQVKSVSQAFLLQLLALDGVSPAKASAIVSRYPTLRRFVCGLLCVYCFWLHFPEFCPASFEMLWFYRLIVTYEECESEQQKMLLLRDIKFGAGFTWVPGCTLAEFLYRTACVHRSIGPTLSKKLYQLYCTESPFILWSAILSLRGFLFNFVQVSIFGYVDDNAAFSCSRFSQSSFYRLVTLRIVYFSFLKRLQVPAIHYLAPRTDLECPQYTATLSS